MMLALCFVGVFVFIVRYLFSNKYGILYLLVECMKLPTIQQIKDEWQLVLFLIVFRLVRDVVANHKTTRYAGAATKVIQKNHLA